MIAPVRDELRGRRRRAGLRRRRARHARREHERERSVPRASHDVHRWIQSNDPAIARRYGATWAIRAGPPLSSPAMKVLIVSLYFPPAGGGGVQRPLKFATHLPELGIETHVLAPDDPKWIHRDDELQPPTLAWVHRARYLGPKGRKPAEELHGTQGLERVSRQAQLAGRRLLVPDENVSWNLTAIPAAIRIVAQRGDRRRDHDLAAVVGAPGRRGGEEGDRREVGRRPARLARRASAPSRRAPARAREGAGRARGRAAGRAQRRRDHLRLRRDRRRDARALAARAASSRSRTAPTSTTSPGSSTTRRDRFRLTHAGSFFGKRDPRPFLTALERVGPRRRRRSLPRRLPLGRPRVGGDARARRPARADPLRARGAARSSCSATRRRCSCSSPRPAAAARACSPGRCSSTSPPSGRSSRSCRRTAPPRS